MTDLLLLGCGWLVWCTLHSLLIWPAISARLQSLLGRCSLYFRLLYNLIALATLLPMMAATAVLRGEVFFSWRGWWVVLQLVLLGSALWLFRDGSRHYDFSFLLGVRQLREQRQISLLSADEQFSRAGSHGLVRHPWYLGSLLFLWSCLPVYHQSSVVAAAVLSCYLVIGTLLEERKLLHEYGEKYTNYQQEVSMLIPVKWLLRWCFGRK